jgi:hypothetical protein
MRRRPPGLVRRVQINRRPSRTCRPRRQRRNKHRARYADTKKPGAIISGAGLLSRLPEGESHICLVHQMVDHVSATKQHRDTNQNRNKERHDRLLSVVRAGGITLFDITRSANILGSARNRGAIRPRSYRFSVWLSYPAAGLNARWRNSSRLSAGRQRGRYGAGARQLSVSDPSYR